MLPMICAASVPILTPLASSPTASAMVDDWSDCRWKNTSPVDAESLYGDSFDSIRIQFYSTPSEHLGNIVTLAEDSIDTYIALQESVWTIVLDVPPIVQPLLPIAATMMQTTSTLIRALHACESDSLIICARTYLEIYAPGRCMHGETRLEF